MTPRGYRPGDEVTARKLTTIQGRQVPLPDPRGLIHLQFRRYAGCPVCDLHLRSVARRQDEIRALGVREVVVFHADPDEVRRYEDGLPFDVVADPRRSLYRLFGVERTPRALANPRAWWPILRAASAWIPAFAAGRRRMFRLRPQGGRLGLPADFLIAGDGRILARKYGEHAGDQWPVDELLALAATHQP